MSQTIELPDKVFTKLKQTAEKDGVAPEVWIEIVVEEESKVLHLPKITDEERKELREFHKRTEEKLGEIWKEKFRKQVLHLNEQNTD
ncbi:MAG: hypothetical protein ACR2MG_08935 [Pyrinomonadaceae bacterium]